MSELKKKQAVVNQKTAQKVTAPNKVAKSPAVKNTSKHIADKIAALPSKRVWPD